jgi:hypothetical protein
VGLGHADDVARVGSESKPNSRSGEDRWKKCRACDCSTWP